MIMKSNLSLYPLEKESSPSTSDMRNLACGGMRNRRLCRLTVNGASEFDWMTLWNSESRNADASTNV